MDTFGSIRGSALRIPDTAGDAGAVRGSITEVDARLDRTLLAVEAMWTILRDKLGVSDLELVERINELDVSDGKLDGRVRRAPVSCPACGRAMPRKFPKCMYCGQAVVHDPFA